MKGQLRPTLKRAPLALVCTLVVLLMISGLSPLAVGFASRTTGNSGPVSGPSNGWSAFKSQTVLVNLLGETFVSPGMVYQGDINGQRNSSFPTLLEGAQAKSFWNEGTVLELARPLPALHDCGLLLFSPAQGEFSGAVNSVVTSNTGGISDGPLAYFFVSPTVTSSQALSYFASSPELGNVFLGAQGDVIFPFSYSPYFVVSWEPAGGGAFDVFAVYPAANGSVTASNIRVLGELGTPPSTLPLADDFLAFNATYNGSTDMVQATIVDENHPTISAQLAFNMSEVGFSAANVSSGTTVLTGLGARGNSPTGWGLLYLSSSIGSNPSPSSSTGLFGLPGDTGNYLLAGAAVIVLAVAALVLLRRRRR